MSRKILRALLLLSAAALLSSCATKLSDVNKARFGSMTLDAADGRGPQPYAGALVPASPDGIKTYRFAVRFAASASDFRTWPALVIGPTAFPYTLSLNGVLLHRYGEPGDQDRTHMYSSCMVPLSASSLQELNLIEIEAELGQAPAPFPELALADSRDASAYVYWRNFFMAQLVAGGFAIGLLLLVYFVFLFLLDADRDPRLLWFALFCGSFAMAYSNMVFNFQALSDTAITKVGRTGFLLCVTFFTFYVTEATGYLNKKKWLKGIVAAAAAVGSAVVIAQRGFVAVNLAFNAIMTIVIIPQLALGAVLIVLAAARKSPRHYAMLGIGYSGVIATSLSDMGFETKNLIPYAWALVYGYLWLVICVFLELALKQARVSRKAVRQAGDLNRKNSILQSVFQHLRSGSDKLAASTEELAVSTREISFTGNQQAAAVKEIVSTMEDANTLLGRISQKSASVRQDSDATAHKADGGAANVRTALEKLEAVIGRISESISMITEFNEQLGSITDIVKLIEGIATQIRIIAFNASLEAVAAGDAGKNFRIVAEEVKRLSDSTMASVKNIRGKVTDLIAKSDLVVKTSRDGYMSLEQSWDIASGIGSSFSGIAEAAESSAQATADIESSIREESFAFEQILQTLKEISSGVNNFVDSSTHTSETTNTINQIAEQLHSLITQYSGESAMDADSPAAG